MNYELIEVGGWGRQPMYTSEFPKQCMHSFIAREVDFQTVGGKCIGVQDDPLTPQR
jgi:hypothetical protein